jgi:hypothetical protein
MTRRYGALVLAFALASGCVTDATETSETEQAVTDCNYGGNFKAAKMIYQPWWNGGQPPAPQAKQGYVAYLDPQTNVWNVLLADIGQGKIVYAVKTTPAQIGSFLAMAGAYGRIVVGHWPPLPPPGGTDWSARFALEYWLRADALPQFALNASY